MTRHHATRFARATGALAITIAATVILPAPPAWAAPAGAIRPFVDCVIPGSDGTYQAVFGYEKADNGQRVPIGPENTLTPSTLNGVQPTTFAAGKNSAAFATPPVPNGQQVSWTLGSAIATANAGSQDCGPKVSLPAEGNGVGGVLVLAVSVLIMAGLVRLKQWRMSRQWRMRRSG